MLPHGLSDIGPAWHTVSAASTHFARGRCRIATYRPIIDVRETVPLSLPSSAFWLAGTCGVNGRTR